MLAFGATVDEALRLLEGVALKDEGTGGEDVVAGEYCVRRALVTMSWTQSSSLGTGLVVCP